MFFFKLESTLSFWKCSLTSLLLLLILCQSSVAKFTIQLWLFEIQATCIHVSLLVYIKYCNRYSRFLWIEKLVILTVSGTVWIEECLPQANTCARLQEKIVWMLQMRFCSHGTHRLGIDVKQQGHGQQYEQSAKMSNNNLWPAIWTEC